MIAFLKIVLLPPGCLLALALAGLLLLRRWPWTGRTLLLSSFVFLYAFSTPACSGLLGQSLQKYPALTESDLAADVEAIVVLGAGDYAPAPEYRKDSTVDRVSLERIRYGAWLHRATGGVPVLTTGGRLNTHGAPIGFAMATALREEFGVPVRWIEDASGNTHENAKFSAEILKREGVEKIYLVTSATHMRRSVAAFEATGLIVVAAPTNLPSPLGPKVGDFMPRAEALFDSSTALYEWFGMAWYLLAYD